MQSTFIVVYVGGELSWGNVPGEMF